MRRNRELVLEEHYLDLLYGICEAQSVPFCPVQSTPCFIPYALHRRLWSED
jgi:hypothetical protein